MVARAGIPTDGDTEQNTSPYICPSPELPGQDTVRRHRSDSPVLEE
jgi:hypothetical protein